MKRVLKYIILILAVAYIGVVSYVYLNQKSLMYHPVRELKDVSEYGLEGVEEVYLNSLDGVKIQTWYKKPKAGMPMIVYYHGNSINLSSRVDKFKNLLKLGYGFVAITYRGFGRSEGYMTQEGIYNDARVGLNFAISLGYAPANIILIGESLGTGVAVKMATEYEVKGVLLITPYTSIADRGQEIYWYIPIKHLLEDNFDSISVIDQVTEPIIIVHGDVDEIVPHTHSEMLVEKIKSPHKLIIYPGIGHSNYDSLDVFQQMSEFLEVVTLDVEKTD